MPPTGPCFTELPGWRDPLDLLHASRGRKRAALLWSGGDSPLARFSVFVADPYLTFSSRGGRISLRDPGGGKHASSEDPLAALDRVLARHRVAALPPWPFAGGAVGCISYDAARGIERLPAIARDDRAHPDIEFAFYGWAISWPDPAAKAKLQARRSTRGMT